MIYYWRKIVKTFAADDDGNVTKVEIDCLQKKKKTFWVTQRDGHGLSGTHKKDIDIVDKEYRHIFYGPEVPMIMENIFRFPDEMAFACLKVTEKKMKAHQ